MHALVSLTPISSFRYLIRVLLSMLSLTKEERENKIALGAGRWIGKRKLPKENLFIWLEGESFAVSPLVATDRIGDYI